MSGQVVITGIGIISALSDNMHTIINNMKEAKSAFKRIGSDGPSLSCQYNGCFTEFDAVPYLGKKGLRYLNRCTKMSLAAAKLCLNDGGLTVDEHNEEDIGVILATNLGVDNLQREMERIVFTEGADSLSPLASPFCSINAIAGQISIRFKPKAFNITVPSGFSSGITSIIMAKNMISAGKANTVMVGGAEELPLEVIKEYDQHHILADSPREMIPYSTGSRGIIPGDGAVFILVEDLTHALARGAHIYAEIDSGFTAFFPGDSNSEYEDLIVNKTNKFLDGSNTKHDEIELIMSSANGSYIDQIEKNGFIRMFKDDTFLFNIKNWFGECFSFTNQLQVGLGAAVIRRNKLSGNSSLKQLKSEFNNNQLSELPREIKNVLVSSCGLDGTFGALLLKRMIEPRR